MQFVLFRSEVSTTIVGPFESEAAAEAWQRADEARFGEISDWTVWPFHSPEEATAAAAVEAAKKAREG